MNQSTFDGQRHPLPTTNAQGRQAFFGIPFDHLVQQGHQHPAPGSTNRVAQGNRPSIDVNPLGIPCQRIAHGQRLGGEGFVGFDQVQFGQLPTGRFAKCCSRKWPG